MTEEFKPGDIVQLKSGGPKMTVTGFASFGEKEVETSWFAGSKLEHGRFSPEALIHVTDAPKTK